MYLVQYIFDGCDKREATRKNLHGAGEELSQQCGRSEAIAEKNAAPKKKKKEQWINALMWACFIAACQHQFTGQTLEAGIKSLAEQRQDKLEVVSPVGPEQLTAEQRPTEGRPWLPQEEASKDKLSLSGLNDSTETAPWTPDISGLDWTKQEPEEERRDGHLNHSKYR